MTTSPRVFVVEDDETIALGVVNALQREQYRVSLFDNGEAALLDAEQEAPSLVLLDIMLPGMDGLEVLRRLKTICPDVQVILLTAKGEELDKVVGLELGADDYVSKPFSLRELIARVKARLRSIKPAVSADTKSPYEFGDVRVDLRRRILWHNGQEQRLTTHEAGVLEYLINAQGRDVPRDELLQEVWGYAPGTSTRTVDNQILKLRKKLEVEPSDPRHILTVHGTGYRFEP
ncbi:MAG: response regulator transcription factor [Myxococcota bacterium]|nr:response regulator transcription factor [Myxococcota bacterium]